MNIFQFKMFSISIQNVYKSYNEHEHLDSYQILTQGVAEKGISTNV